MIMKNLTMILTMTVVFLATGIISKSDSTAFKAKYSELVIQWKSSTNHLERTVLEKQMDDLKTELLQEQYRTNYSMLINQWVKTDDHAIRIDIESKIERLKANNLHLFQR
jgi:hypothetical protein